MTRRLAVLVISALVSSLISYGFLLYLYWSNPPEFYTMARDRSCLVRIDALFCVDVAGMIGLGAIWSLLAFLPVLAIVAIAKLFARD